MISAMYSKRVRGYPSRLLGTCAPEAFRDTGRIKRDRARTGAASKLLSSCKCQTPCVPAS